MLILHETVHLLILPLIPQDSTLNLLRYDYQQHQRSASSYLPLVPRVMHISYQK